MKFLQSTVERAAYLALLLVFVLAIAGATYNLNQNKSIREILVANCQSANEFRTDQLKLWSYILNVTPEEPPTPEEQKVRQDFTVFLNKTFELRDCSEL